MGFDVERALFAMVANRACAPCSKLYCWEQWLKEEVHIAGTKELSLQHLYRAMDFLEANKEAIERAIFHRVADLLNLDVEVMFYDTTSLHFEVNEEDSGLGAEDIVHGSAAAGRKAYKAPRKRGHPKNGRSDVPQIVVGMAVTREGFPVRHWVFPGNTVDVTTVARVKQDLRVDGVKQDGRLNDIHLGRLDGDECRCLLGHGSDSFGWLSLSLADGRWRLALSLSRRIFCWRAACLPR
jgi:hypothetical protein